MSKDLNVHPLYYLKSILHSFEYDSPKNMVVVPKKVSWEIKDVGISCVL